MTSYLCPCGALHATDEPPCPQVVTVPAPPAEPSDVPLWHRRYRCPQCLDSAQPRRGFDVVGFQEHVFSHAVAALNETTDAARRFEYRLQEIENALAVDGLAWTAARRAIRFHVALALHPQDKVRIDALFSAAPEPTPGEGTRED